MRSGRSFIEKFLKLWVAALLAASFLSAHAYASKFSGLSMSFELPDNWKCHRDGTEWVCENKIQAKGQAAMIIMASKQKSDKDSIDQYLAYLKAPKSYGLPNGKTLTSTPKFARKVSVSGKDWVDAIQWQSELPGFYTRYLATVHDDTAVLITYSATGRAFDLYVKDVEQLVQGLKTLN